MRNTFLILLLFAVSCTVEKSVGTSDSVTPAPVLFSIEEDTVFADEFIYVYSKNNQNNDSAFTREDITEYLRLYENFKLKVHEGRARGMDTTEAYYNEMKAYEAQLKKPYLTETEVTDQLVQEAYDRFSREIRARHILAVAREDASPSDTLKAYEKITEIRDMAVNGAPFDSLAREYSDDPSGKTTGGDLQYFTSLQMVYPFETAAYNTPIGEISPVVRSQFGYHILQILDTRPANNRVNVSHIMIRHDQEDDQAARDKIFGIYDQAVGGVDWQQLVETYSEDPNSKEVGGRLQAFSVRQLPFDFQEAAFALQPGEISDPVRTDFGWHIIRMEQRLQLPELSDMEESIRERIQQDERANRGHDALIARLANEWNATMLVSPSAPVVESDTLSLFRIGDSTFTTPGYVQFVDERGLQEGESPEGLVKEYFEASLIAYEEAHLEEKYVDYRMLLREYREGILLFQLMDQEIWSKAAKDSTGLALYYEGHKTDYPIEGMIKGVLYVPNSPDQQDSLYSYVRDNVEGALEDLVKQYEQRKIVTSQKVEASPAALGIIDESEVYAGQVMMIDKGFLKIFEYEPSRYATFDEIKGKIIAGYQDQLEKEWIMQLRSSYNVILNEDGLEYVYEELVR